MTAKEPDSIFASGIKFIQPESENILTTGVKLPSPKIDVKLPDISYTDRERIMRII